jgi:hypothetical protein
VTSEPPVQRRWFQFRLRALVLALLVLSLPLSWFAVRTERARRQKAAVQAIRGMGGIVVEREGASVPKWIRELFPDGFFLDVIWVNLEGPHITDAELEHLHGMCDLEELCFTYTQVTDAGLEQLGRLDNLEFLWLTGAPVTDDGLKHLEATGSLKWPGLRGTQVTDEGIRKFQEALPNCKIEY